LDEKKAQLVVEEIRQLGGDAIAVGGDVGAADFPKRILDATIAKYGKLNHIVNNGTSQLNCQFLGTFAEKVFFMVYSWIHIRQDAAHDAR
jgi:hypothetical protein